MSLEAFQMDAILEKSKFWGCLASPRGAGNGEVMSSDLHALVGKVIARKLDF